LNQLAARVAPLNVLFVDAKKKPALTLFIIGFGFSIAGFVVNGLAGGSAGSPRLAQMCSLMMTFGNTAVLMASIMLARTKGYAWYVGLLGALNFIGFAIVWFALKDRAAS
jgi:hypothetical protein